MKRILLLLVCLTGFVSNSHAASGPADFTRAYANVFKKRAAHLTIEIVRDLELRVTDPSKKETTIFLHNAYDAYKLAPADGHAVIERYVDVALSPGNASAAPLDRTHIVPVIKDRAWFEETQSVLRARGQDVTKLNYFKEEYNAELTIFYALDDPKTIRYLGEEDIAKLGISRTDLRALAIRNLHHVIAKIELHGTPELYMMTAGGDYEASLLLDEKIWTGGQVKVEGDIVVAVPARDMLLITGSKSAAGLAKLKALAEKNAKTAPYRLTAQPFVFRDGKFVPFDQ
ncbi:MAG: DUF1444 family protein [Verrucomicrobia bacterium]|nr:DUF1444 family protein [Verrucomicrobiota bacterium]